jgi:hypothetical protein
MKTKQLNKEQILAALQGKITIMLGGSSSLYVRGLSTKVPGDLDLIIMPNQFQDACTAIEAMGGIIWLDHPDSVGFDLRRQYKIGDEKVDLFIVGMNPPVDRIGDYYYAKPEMVWAARGYYAGKGSKKYQDQLIAGGFWTEDRRPTGKQKRMSFTKKVKLWLKPRLLRLVSGL